jgi:L-seryl-tRNA(Ser) seleniumtransferase
MLTERPAVLAARANRLLELIAELEGLGGEIGETRSFAGGGAMPMNPLSSFAIALRADKISANQLAGRLRTGPVAVIGRIERDTVLLDMRTVADDELTQLVSAIHRAIN